MSDNTNIVSAFLATASSLGDRLCSYHKEDDRWHTMKWTEMAEAVRNVAANLVKLGFEKGDRAVIFGKTSPKWAIADIAIMASGGVCVPIYQSYTSERVAFILNDTKPKFAFVDDHGLIDVFDEAVDSYDSKEKITVIGMYEGEGLTSLPSLIARADTEFLQRSDSILATISEDDVATCVYTSGTTGDLKGVILTHRNLLAEIRAAQDIFNFRHDELGLLWLPLAHVLGRMMEFYQLVNGCQTVYAYDIKHLPEVYLEMQPHYVCGVPRMLEKIHERIKQYLNNLGPIKKRIFTWAISVGTTRSNLLEKHKRVPWHIRLKFDIVRVLIFRRLKKRLGGRIRCFICGGAMLPKEVARFLHATDITVLEGYGLTETFAAAAVNRFDDYHFGTVGKPIHGTEFKIADDGEILIKGPTVFKEYFNLPEKTRQAFDDEGWFLTGDLGEFTKDGFLRITGRKKEIIITAGGKNIAPVLVERIMSDSPYINNVMVYGDGEKYLTALITLNEKTVEDYLKNHGYPIADGQILAEHPAVQRLVEKHVELQNRRLSSYETVKHFRILEHDFSIESEELTPTMKIRRDFVIEKYRDLLIAMY